ncbi:MAG: hypothetical protein IKJ88_04205 [Clostridia bacterium]|nr:hypothetical protein [Clostridia bacterium]
MNNKNQISIIIKEYFDIISPLLTFEDCETIYKTERQILSLLCEVKKCTELVDECWAIIEDTKCLQLSSDSLLPISSDNSPHSVAYNIKTEILSECRINRIKKFEEFTFIENLKDEANVGERNSCQLLAVLNWLGLIVPENRVSAQNIWAVLAINGDRLSIEMLIFGHKILGEVEQEKKWMHIYDILQTEYDAFSVIALYSNYAEYAEEEVQLANLIMFISQKNHNKGTNNIDRAMTHYILNSKSDYKSKMDKLSSETNYYLATHIEDKASAKKYGFN